MIKKLKRRYLITNMLLLSSTLLVCLAVLFGFLYHSAISSSYSVMQEMMKETRAPEHKPGDMKKPDFQPTANDGSGGFVELAAAASANVEHWNDPGSHDHHNNDDSNENEPAPDDTDCNESEDKGYGGFYQPPYWYFPSPYDGGQDNGQQDGQDDGQDNEQQDGQNDWQIPPWYVPGPWVGPPPWVDPSQWGDPNPEQTEPPDYSDDRHPVTQDETAETQPWHEPDHTHETRPDKPDPDFTMTRVTKDPHRPDETQTNETGKRPPHDHDDPASGSTQPGGGGTTYTETVTVPPAAGYQDTEPPQTDSSAPLVPVHEGEYVPDAFVAKVDPDGNIESYAGNDAHSSEDEHFKTVHHAIDEVKRRGSHAGTIDIGDNSYRFLYQPDETGSYRLVLLDRTLELSTLSRLLFIFVLITVLGLLVMFGISVLLANWTVTPVAVAWEKQKQFVADASHELKTPLAVISANTEVILANPAESVSGQSKWLNYIQSETMRMSKLITNLLSVARMDSANTKEQLAPISLSEAVSNVCLVFEPIIYENGKTLNTIIQRNVTLRAEEDNIKQLLSILLDNATLHSVPHAQITVSLSKDTQHKIRLTVSNTAKDIPKEQLAHLFDRFYRVDTEGSPNGSGLGLSIAKSIVNQMGGTLTVTSENQLVTFVATFSP